MESQQPVTGRPLSADAWLLAIALVAMVILNFAGVVFRYLIHVSLPWIEEIETGLLVWLVFLGAGLTISRGLHIGFAPIVEALPGVARRVLWWLGRACFAALFMVLLWFGTNMVRSEISYGQTTATLGWPEAVIGVAVPVGAAVALIRILLIVVRSRN